MTWLETAIASFGDPHLAFPEPIGLGDRKRRCWLFFVDGQNFNLAIDDERGSVHGLVRTTAASPGRHAYIVGDDEPDDANLHAICAFAWPGFGERRPA